MLLPTGGNSTYSGGAVGYSVVRMWDAVDGAQTSTLHRDRIMLERPSPRQAKQEKPVEAVVVCMYPSRFESCP
jgi:hypothetical protein